MKDKMYGMRCNPALQLPINRGQIAKNKTLQIIFILIFSFFNLHSLSASSDTTAGRIIYPYNATTAIVKAGENFDVWFHSNPGQVVNSIILKSPYIKVSIPAGSITTTSGNWQYDSVSGNTYNTKVKVSVPLGIPEDRYDLILNTSEGEVISNSAVKVIREYKTHYKIFLIADSHLGHRGSEQVPNKLSAFVDMANIINADIVAILGDVVHYHSDPTQLKRRMDLFYQGNEAEGLKGMHDFNAAAFVVAGNHDFQEGGSDGLPYSGYYDLKSDYWNQWHGLQNHFFTYGNSRFMIFNNGWNEYDWQWQRDRAHSWLHEEGSNGNLNVAFAHISRTEYMDTFARDNNIGLYVLGHNHHLGDRNPYIIDQRLVKYYARSVREYMEFLLFRVDDTNGTYMPMGYPNIDPGTEGYGLSTANNKVLENDEENTHADRSTWIYNLSLNFEHENNGNSPFNTATLVNKYEYDIPDARVRFIMPKGAVYSVLEGDVYQAFDGDKFHIVDVDIDLNACSTTVVSIAPVK